MVLWMSKTVGFLLGSSLCACSGAQIDTGPDEQPRPLCDETNDTRLLVRFDGSGPEPVEGQFALASGVQYLYVTGQCEFWVNEQSWFTKHGRLDDAAAKNVESFFGFSDLRGMRGTWRTRECYDASILRVSDGQSTATCLCECQESGTPGVLRAVSDGLGEFLQELMAEGAVWDGPMDALIFEEETLEDQEPVSWSDELELADYLTPREALAQAFETDTLPDGKLVEGRSAELLRGMIAEYELAHASRALLGNPVPALHEGITYAIYARDRLPIATLDPP